MDGPLSRAVRSGAICYLDEIVEARKDTTVIIHSLTDHRRMLPIEKTAELIEAHPDFLLVISYNPGYQGLLKDLKPSTRQRFVALAFDYPDEERESAIIAHESGVDATRAAQLVQIAHAARRPPAIRPLAAVCGIGWSCCRGRCWRQATDTLTRRCWSACVGAFQALLAHGESSTQAMQMLALTHAARTRRQSDQLAAVHFDDTVVSYRDDNRLLWLFIEAGDEEDSFAAPARPSQEDVAALPPRHYPEWDAASASYRPDWVSVYEALHPAAMPA